MLKRETNKIKLSVTIDIEINELVENEIAESGFSRSTIINWILNEHFCQRDLKKELLEQTYGDDKLNKSERVDSFLMYKPLTTSIILLRHRKFGIGTNVPRLVINRSPMGYEWGYYGAGPSDLALNILEAVMTLNNYRGVRKKCFTGDCWNAAYHNYESFCDRFIAVVPQKGAVIPYDEVRRWVFENIEDMPPAKI